jgi:hypothetical protein
MDTLNSTKEPLKVYHDKTFGYNIHGNYNLVKFSEMSKFTDFTLKNRGIDDEHVENIYKTIKSNPNFTMPPIELISTILVNENEDKIYVGNGQHRFLAYKKLYETDHIDLNLIVMFHEANNDNEMENIIKIINSGKPVTTMFNFKERNEFIEKIKSAFNNVFSKNTSHHRDKMNEITLRDQLDKNKIFNGLNTCDNIFNHLIKFNEKIRQDSIVDHKCDKDLYNKIKNSHKFFCLMLTGYTWINIFSIHLNNTMKQPTNPDNIKEIAFEYKIINKNNKDIKISGDWDDWTTKENMIYDKVSNSCKIQKKLHKGVYEYKFVINDKYELHPSIEKCFNKNGYENHRLIIK